MKSASESPQTDLSKFWEDSTSSYEKFPAVRHRWRFLVHSLRRARRDGEFFLFDYGCGPGHLLLEARREFGLRDDQLGGCDISGSAFHLARAAIGSPFLFNEALPKLDRLCDAIVCSEVIEHTEQYSEILAWCAAHLKPGGMLILTTASGRRCRVDHFVGHLRHFRIGELSAALADLGLRVEYARLWGFPFYSLQKRVSDLCFNFIRHQFIEGTITNRRTWVFRLSYAAYFLHDLIPLGPQILIRATNSKPEN